MTVESAYNSANPEIQSLNEQSKKYSDQIMTLVEEVQKVIVGQEQVIKKLVIAMMADGHVLLEGVPGLAKTKMVDTLSKTISSNFCRIQFTPDLLPADIIGTKIYDNKEEKFTTEKGPIFSNLILADEINRAPPKVQSALLEAMQERQVSIHGDTYEIEKPFQKIYADEKIEEYVSSIVDATRNPKNYDLGLDGIIEFGASPRASIWLILAAKAHALLSGRGFVIPEDIKSIANDVLRHRIILTFEAEAEGNTSDDLINKILEKVRAP